MLTERIIAAAAGLAREFCSAKHTADVLPIAAKVLQDITGAEGVMVYLVERQLDCLVVKADTDNKCLGASFSLQSEDFPCQVVQSGKVYSEPGNLLAHPLKAQINGYLGIPLLRRDDCFGLIELLEPERNFLENPDDLNALIFPVSMVLRNEQITEELHQQAEFADIINRIAKITSSSLRIDVFYDDFVNELRKLLDFDRISIALVDELQQTLKVYALATNNLNTRLGKGNVLPLAGTAPEWVIKNKKPNVVKDLEQEATFLEDPRLLEEGIRSAIRMPLVIKDSVLATLQLNSSKKGIYGKRELRILQKVADRIAEAVENTVLFNRAETINEQLKQQNVRLEALNSVALAVNESLELEEVLQKALNKVLEVTGWDCGDILTWDDESQSLSMVVHRGLSERFVSDWQIQKDNSTIAFKTAVTGEPEYISNVDDSPELAYLRIEGIVSAIHIPLWSKQKLVGVMPIATRKPRTAPPDQELLNAIGNQIGVAIENARLYRQIRDLAEKDSLTGLWNRRKFFEFLEREVNRSQRYHNPFAILMIDVDYFKKFNDTFGHLEGDRVLAAVGQIIEKNIRGNDFAARLGGEEFAVLALVSGGSGAWELAERIRTSIEAEGADKPFPTVSIGYGIYHEDGNSRHELLLAADAALYAAKNAGRNKTVWKYQELS